MTECNSLLNMPCNFLLTSNLFTVPRKAPPQVHVGDKLSVLICEHFTQASWIVEGSECRSRPNKTRRSHPAVDMLLSSSLSAPPRVPRSGCDRTRASKPKG